MPKPRQKNKEVKTEGGKSLDELLFEDIDRNIKILSNADTDIEDIKAVSCSFYRKGLCPECLGCEQFEDTVRDCAAAYVSKIRERPMRIWSKEFDEIEQREVKTEDKADLNIKLQCNTCYFSSNCPKYKRDATCSLDWNMDTSLLQPHDGILFLIGTQLDRIKRAKAIEEYDGGVPDKTLSSEMDRLLGYYQALGDLDTTRVKITATASIPGGGGGGERKEGGILSKIFGGLVKGGDDKTLPESTHNLPITEDVEHVEIKDKNEVDE